MRINYIYGGIRYDKSLDLWYPKEYGYVFENNTIYKFNHQNFIRIKHDNEISIRIGKARSKKFEKINISENILFVDYRLMLYKKNESDIDKFNNIKNYLKEIQELIDKKNI